MAVDQNLEINSINTVLDELSPLIEAVQQTLQSSLEQDQAVDAADVARRCGEIHGTLLLLDLAGAAALAEEMQALAAGLAVERIDTPQPALEALLKAVFKLPDYLDRIRTGQRDAPVVLLPLINELRAARGETALSEWAMFFPDLDVVPGEAPPAGDVAAVQTTARQLRPRFQQALLGWYRGDDAERCLADVAGVLQELARIASNPTAVRLWNICAALTDSLVDQGLETDAHIKRLMGRIERLISQLVRSGEGVLADEVSFDLLRTLLYYVARSGSDSERVRAVKQAYRLDELLPGNEVRAGFEGPNSELLGVVGDGIRADLAQVKDAVELYVHSEQREAGMLEGLPERLNQIADTFSMLGLQDAHDTLGSEAVVLAGIEEYAAAEPMNACRPWPMSCCGSRTI